jgi:hypothetical protein
MRLRLRAAGITLVTLSVAGLVAVALAGGQTATGAASVDPRDPVIFVPGVTGVGLEDASTGRLTWGLGRNLLRPHDRGYGTARSLSAAHPGPEIVPAGVILEIKLFGLVRYRIYQELVDRFRSQGYQWGSLEQPRAADDFFLFSYDWRQDNVASAARLARQLESLRQLRGRESLRVHLICQSNGAHICRYYAKYGELDLEEAAAGSRPPVSRVAVDNLILVGASNGGSIRVLRELNRGRRYIDLVGRYWSPETLFTFESLFQDLPVYTTDLFVDAEGRSLAVDLFEATNWGQYGWSIYGTRAARRLGRHDVPPWLGSPGERARYLAAVLERARRFHRLLQTDRSNAGASRYHLITNRGRETSSRAILVDETKGWQTWFGDDPWVRRRPELARLVQEGGDGHATASSQMWLSPRETRRLVGSVVEVDGTHRRIVLEEAAFQRIMEILSQPVSAGG